MLRVEKDAIKESTHIMKVTKVKVVGVLIALTAIVYLMNQSHILDRYNSSKYGNISQFREYFLSRHPTGTAEDQVDSFLVNERGFKKSRAWHFEKYKEHFTRSALGASEDHYQITYFKPQGYYQEDLRGKAGEVKRPLGYFFTLKYSLSGELMDVASKGTLSRRSKGTPMYLNSIFDRTDLIGG